MWQSAHMTLPADAATPGRATSLALRALDRPRAPFRTLPPRLLVVDVERQTLSLIADGAEIAIYPVSTAAAGIGGAEGSMRTPPGWHRIHGRIGGASPAGAVFESRLPTGAVWRGEPREEDLILSRILTLDGLEDGVNRGPGCDSLARYVYIHGTNHEGSLGRPASHGCVRMASADLIALFDCVAAGDAVLIAGGEEAPHV